MTRQEFLRLIASGSIGSFGARTDVHADTAAQTPAKTFPLGVTKTIVDFVTRTSETDIPDRAIAEAKRCLIDGFGVILAGASTEGSAIVREYIKSTGSTARDASVLGHDRLSATAAHAALANGASGHAMDYDDTQLSSSPDRVFGLLTHPTVPVLASALAVGERLGVSGRVFLEAFLVGFEVECKIAEAIRP